MADVLSCPFCDFTSSDSYFLILHVEELHTDDSPFKVTEPSEPPTSALSQTKKEQPRNRDDSPFGTDEWVLCPEKDCDEQVYLSELNEHLDLHLAAGLTEPEHSSSTKRDKMFTPIASEHSFHSGLSDRHRHGKMRPRADSQKSTLARSILDIFCPVSRQKGGPKRSKEHSDDYGARLGKAELGPYAYEDQMPNWLYEQLKAGGKKTTLNRIGRDGRLIKHEIIENETPGVLPMLAQLCALEKSVKHAYLCHPATLQIGKTRREGSFCGYRNLQMLVSYIQGAKAQGHDRFTAGTPNILKLQDMVEDAWDKGISEIAREQTGGIRGTRKYIGTPEVEAVLRSLEIDHGIQMFTDRDDSQAHEQLLADIEGYFRSGVSDDTPETKIYKTCLPPIYLQQPGHSLTIVGFEKHHDGSRNLLVFDPQFNPTPGMMMILGRRGLRTPRPELLHVYRRGHRHLSKRRDFEMIKLTAHPPLFPVWDV
ncbi:uncharacterized protein K452DRAFT_12731 [Aplosporella prunicola CBS 121167]|uniref:C2H2-type domain-containing protein n=1 Tax=Aplosporella prunicola CBS 121167 TaxID=1176127 RepID=A0A6A6BHI0_9PEZI|nr:uncharacterized protein K452DRAFT_12731 [Aplosporella prunicola CBS 121167]KAF2142903.1 hypothetical protein K452DRAFT_12731 [Aplosporella prunicola CBS 121167]